MTEGPIPLVRSGLVTPFLQFLDEIGAPCERRLEEAHLSPHFMARQDTLVPLHQALAFIDRAAVQEGVPYLGLLVGQRTRVAGVNDLMQLLMSSPSLYVAITRLLESIGLINSAARLSLRTHGDKACFCHDLAIGRATRRRQGDLLALTLMIDVVRLAAGPHWRPRAVWVPAAEMAHRDAYEALLQTPVLLGARGWAVAFEATLLAQPLLYCSDASRDRNALVGRLEASAPAEDFTGSLRQVIAALLPRGSPNIRIAAAVAGLTARTLQRRLNASGASYSCLVDEVRLQLARRMLQETDAKLVDVALELGYTDAANFTRAFRRWTGVPPRVVRSGGVGHRSHGA